MKKLSIIVLIVATTLSFTSCKGTKSVAKNTGGFKEVKIPCGDKGKSDSKHFRANSVGKSNDMATSKDKALVITKQRLASLISSKVKAVSERYVNEMDVAGATEFEQTFENMTRDVVNQQLVDITITCEKTGVKDDGSYETYIALEVDKESIYNGIDQGISKDKKLQVMYDRAKFKEKYDEEMSKLE